jgi:hypothetical protein
MYVFIPLYTYIYMSLYLLYTYICKSTYTFNVLIYNRDERNRTTARGFGNLYTNRYTTPL